MWEKTLIESNVYSRRRNRWTMPVAALLHFGMFLGIVLFSYWRLEAIEAPPASVPYFAHIPIAIGTPLAHGQRRAPNSKSSAAKSASPVHNVQPTAVPPLRQEVETSDVSNENEGPDSDWPIGDSHGIEGGYPGAQDFAVLGTADVDSEEPQVVTVNMVEPVLIRRIEPEYPRIALMGHIQGIVILQAVITRSGSVEEVKTMRADYPVLEKAAKDAVLQWKYKPATLRGQPVKVYFTVTVTFHLK